MNAASNILKSIVILALPYTLISCSREPETLFRRLDAEETGVFFSNVIKETEDFNILTYEYIYNGGGVAAADFNADGKTDLFFTGNEVPNRLYLNEGDFRFKDITETAKVNVLGRWNSGVAVVDINNDRRLDLYVTATRFDDSEKRRNMLFINTGNDSEGNPVFKESAQEFGLDYDGNSMMAAFLDYDLDGDLDCYILENVKLLNAPTNYRPKITDGTAANNDRLFRNEGNGKFKDVSIEAGIRFEGFGLGLSVSDINLDGWPDIYVSNDYLANDIFYLNQKNGTFRNATDEFFSHQSQFSMGNDAADMNNDGLTDVITLDMLPENSERKKTTIGNKTYQNYLNNDEFGYTYQYVRNMLQLNNGADKGFRFSEIGQLAGVAQTEWSWSPLFADFDNDGWRDLAITNGFPKDITDKDFANYRASIINLASPAFLIDSIPVVRIPNYIYRNKGDLTFSDMTKEWGFDVGSFSNGAVFADLDNDGDLDYIVNNIDDPAFVYENQLITPKKKSPSSSFLRIKLEGPAGNTLGLGSKVTVFYDSGKILFQDFSIYRGYLSSVENILHFGLGAVDKVDSLKVQWPDGKIQILKNISANQILTLQHVTAKETTKILQPTQNHFFLEQNLKGLSFQHQEKDVIDFNYQRTIPHKFSQSGPGLSVGDVNGDRLDDMIVSGTYGSSDKIFMQIPGGTFRESNLPLTKTQDREGISGLLFDADGDGDSDYYSVAGGFEWPANSASYQHLLWLNDGNGNFTVSPEGSLPDIRISGSCARAADMDQDGDLDLFVSGRVVPHRYPESPNSILLRNDNGRFVDVSDSFGNEVRMAGMINDALWTDVNNDHRPDLMIAGELMPITFFINDGQHLRRISTNLDAYKGWWSSIAAADIDLDGDTDYVVGNLGSNNLFSVGAEMPYMVFGKDMDGNGSLEALTFCHSKMLDGSVQACPVHFWDELNQQSPLFRRRYNSYRDFSHATMVSMIGKDPVQDGIYRNATYAFSSYVENLENGQFKLTALPTYAQLSPTRGIIITNVNSDEFPDVVLVGNDFANEVFIGRRDAQIGLVLLGNGKGQFKELMPAQTGFYVDQDAKALVKMVINGMEFIIASRNRNSIKVFASGNATKERYFSPNPLDQALMAHLSDGKKQFFEVFYGSGYLSQSTSGIKIPDQVVSLEVFNSKGEKRIESLNRK